MERRRFRYLAPLALLIVLLGLAYRSNNAMAEQAHPLIADSWNSAFYSALSVDNQSADAEIPPIGYPDDVLGISGVGIPGSTVSGFPGSVITLSGYPNPTTPLSGGTQPPGDVSGFPYPPISITGNPGTVTGYPKPPISVTGNPVSACRRPVAITAVGFPYGPVKIKWSAVAGATSYWVAIGAIPPQKKYYVLLVYTNVAAPTLTATLPLNHAEAQAVVSHGSPYVVLVEPKGGPAGTDCISIKQYSTAVVRKTITPATKPANQPVEQVGNSLAPTPTLILPTPIPTVFPNPNIATPCPYGTRGDPQNGHPCQPITPATQPPPQPTACPRGTIINPLGPGCVPERRQQPTPCPPGTQGNPGGPCIDIPR